MMSFSIDTATKADRCDVILTGELDVYTADDLAAVGLLSLSDPNVRTLAIDLGGVTFIDSTGVGALVRIRNTALELEKNLFLGNRSPRVEKILSITGLDGAFSVDGGSDGKPVSTGLHWRSPVGGSISCRPTLSQFRLGQRDVQRLLALMPDAEPIAAAPDSRIPNSASTT